MRRRFVTAMTHMRAGRRQRRLHDGRLRQTLPRASTSSAKQDPLGVVTIAPGQPIVLGTLLTATGPAADLGVDSLRGVKLALDYLDLKFDGTAGHALRPPRTAPVEGRRSAAGRGVSGRRAAFANDPQRARRHRPHVLGDGAGQGPADPLRCRHHDDLTLGHQSQAHGPRRNTFRSSFGPRTTGSSEGAAAADFADSTLKARRAATAYEAEPQGDAATTGFVDRFEELGGFITGSFAIPSDPAKSLPLLQAMSEEGADLLYTTNVGTRCADLTHVWDGMASAAATAFVGGAGCMVPAVIAGRTGQSKTVYVVGPDLTRMAEGAFYRTEFLPAYEAQFGTPPIAAFHAYAYDATDIVLDAIQLAATRYKDGTITIGRSALRDAVFGTKDYQGVTGTLSCTPLGECSTDPALAVYLLPAVPLEGGDPTAKPVFSESVSLQGLVASPTPTP